MQVGLRIAMVSGLKLQAELQYPNITKMRSRLVSRFVLSRYWFLISERTPTLLTEVFHGLPQFVQENGGMLLRLAMAHPSGCVSRH